MKTTRTVALAFSLVLFGTEAGDVRQLGGATVSLDPVHRWMTTRRGERPMPHWRDFTPVDYLGIINGGHAFRVIVALDGDPAPRLVIGIDGSGYADRASHHVVGSVGGGGSSAANSETKEILLKNPPPAMLRLGQQVRDLKVRLGWAESGELAARRGAVVAAAFESMTPRTSHGRFGNQPDAREQAAHNRSVMAQTARQLTAMERDALEKALSRCQPPFRETHELAMFTGQTIDGREVWDCGYRAP